LEFFARNEKPYKLLYIDATINCDGIKTHLETHWCIDAYSVVEWFSMSGWDGVCGASKQICLWNSFHDMLTVRVEKYKPHS
jgi:hypothetical protein